MKELSQEIHDLRFTDLVRRYPVSVRLKNCILAAHEKGNLPFDTIGEYIKCGKSGNDNLLKINNLGKKTADELLAIIETISTNESKQSEEENEPNNLSNEISIEVRSKTIAEIIMKSSASNRLRRCVETSAKEGGFPFETVQDYLDNKLSARDKLKEVRNLGNQTADEFINIVESVLVTGLPKQEKRSKKVELVEFLNEEYPGVFQPLIDMYDSTPETDLLRIDSLEAVLNVLQDKKDHAEMAWFRFSGETLESIGKSFGVTRERVRQITNKYTAYITDTNSSEWAEKSIRHLIKKNNTGDIFPENIIIDKYHPKLAISLVKNFSERKSGKLTPERRLEIAKSLNLNIENELIHLNRWTLEKTLFEVRRFANELGKPDLMPMQKEFVEHGRQDLRGAVGRYGGQSKVASLAGLTYQGQMVAPDGTRTYWTEERIRKFLHEVATIEGHPGVMPTQNEVRKHAEKPDTIITIFTRAAYPTQKTISWYELAREHGLQYEKGIHRVTRSFIKAFVKSLGDALYYLTPAEIFVLFEQQGISKTGDNLYRDRSFDNLVDAIQSGYLPKEEVKKWVDGDKGELVEALLDKNIKTVEEAFNSAGEKLEKRSHKKKNDNPNDEPYREDVENRLPIPSAGDSLDTLKTSTDILTQASSDREAVEFLIAKAADKLWKRCFYDEESAVSEARNHKGNIYSENARDTFIEEYTRCKQLPIPEGYSFTDPKGVKRHPKLMQRLIAYRVLTKNHVLNLSGTGTGKTLSAILSSRVIGAKLTIITCPNATVEAWKNNILNAFPKSEVIIKPINWKPIWKTNDVPHYLVVNHEMLQNRNESSIKRFINTNPYDLIVIDELHQVKQRDADSETQRRRLLTGLITDIPEDRPNPRVLGMSATPIINNLQEGKSLVELVTSLVHDDIGKKPSIPNCMRMYQRFTSLGFRMIPKSEVSREPKIYPVDATPLLGELISLGTRPHPQQVDAVLIKARWPIIKQHIKKKDSSFY